MSTIPSEYTPQPEHISPPTSVTPTRHASNNHLHHAPQSVPSAPPPDFTSPSAYINHDAYSSTPTDSNTYDPSASSSLSIPQSATMSDYDFQYTDFSEFLPSDPSPNLPSDDRTPVVSENQQQIPPRSFPAPPTTMHGDETVRASNHERKPLMSPFRPMHGNPAAMPPQPQSQNQPHPAPFMDASGQMYYANPMPMMYDSTPQYVSFQAPMSGPVYAHPQSAPQYYQPVMQPQYDYGPPRSRNGSPTSSISSSAVSLVRSASTSSELRPARPKVKLTWEDKRTIVELHRANSSLRQEDIARQYGVDRSTISKILLASHRWTQPQEIHAPNVPKAAKAVGGRFPAIEAKMDQWMDEQISAGLDVRDNIAREKAKDFAREIGFPVERFKASAKWLDKFKDRRKAAGKPNTSPMVHYGYYPYTSAPYPDMSHPVMLSRSQSAVTLSSSDSSGQEMYQPSPGQHSMLVPTPEVITPHHISLTRSETDLLHIESTPSSRQRSQSSPHLLGEPGMQSPSSGKANRFMRPSPLNLQRQNSYHGTSPSPRRPVPLTRANSTQGGIIRRSRPTSLAASAFGITPIIGEDHYGGSPLQSPSTSSSGTHSRQRSDASSLAPFTSSMGGMTISPDMSDSGEPVQIAVPPLTPITPGHGHGASGAVFPNTDYSEINTTPHDFVVHHQPVPHGQSQYATMPNKHYIQQQYAYAPPGGDFGPVYAPPNGHPGTTWR